MGDRGHNRYGLASNCICCKGCTVFSCISSLCHSWSKPIWQIFLIVGCLHPSSQTRTQSRPSLLIVFSSFSLLFSLWFYALEQNRLSQLSVGLSALTSCNCVNSYCFDSSCRLRRVLHPLIHLLISAPYEWYILFACLHCTFPHLSFLLHFFLYIPSPLRIGPLHFRAGCRKRRPNLDFFSCHYIFALWFLLSFYLFSSPNLSCCRLDVCHSCTHGVALVRI